jgi:uncharacterized iron-regulated membrane protein
MVNLRAGVLVPELCPVGVDWRKNGLKLIHWSERRFAATLDLPPFMSGSAPRATIPAMVVLRFALIALVLSMLGPLSVIPADAEPRMRCLTRDQQRSAITERRAVPLAAVRKSVRAKVPGEMVRARLCQEPERLIYQLTVLPRDGKVRRVIVDAKSGNVVSVR